MTMPATMQSATQSVGSRYKDSERRHRATLADFAGRCHDNSIRGAAGRRPIHLFRARARFPLHAHPQPVCARKEQQGHRTKSAGDDTTGQKRSERLTGGVGLRPEPRIRGVDEEPADRRCHTECNTCASMRHQLICSPEREFSPASLVSMTEVMAALPERSQRGRSHRLFAGAPCDRACRLAARQKS